MTSNQSKVVELLLLLILCLNVASAPAAAPDNQSPVSRRVLFIGNSYTAQIKDCLTQMLEKSHYHKSVFAFIVRGGADLQYHLSNEETLKRIKLGKWDYVVIQEQSQIPAFGGKHERAFHCSVDQFTKVIREAGAEPILYMTWGRRDGDPDNQGIFPDYETMQKRLSSAYIAAARRNQVLMAPVGDAWSAVRQSDNELGRALYKADGSHPSEKGAHLSSYVFFWGLFPGSLSTMEYQGTLTKAEVQIFKNAIFNLYPEDDEAPHPKKDRAARMRAHLKMRMEYSKSEDYNPYAPELGKIQMNSGRLLEEGKYDQCLEKVEEGLSIDGLNITLLVDKAAALRGLGKTKQADEVRAKWMSLIDSIVMNGDGTSFESAFQVISIGEEYAVLGIFDLQPGMQKLVVHKGSEYDVIDVPVDAEGTKKSIYFNIDIPRKWLIENLRKGGEQAYAKETSPAPVH